MEDVATDDLVTEEQAEDGKAQKGRHTPETQIARMLVRAIWTQEWNEAHPEAKGKERAQAWKEARAAENNARGKIYRKALAAMRKAGVEITLPADLGVEDEAAEE